MRYVCVHTWLPKPVNQHIQSRDTQPAPNTKAKNRNLPLVRQSVSQSISQSVCLTNSLFFRFIRWMHYIDLWRTVKLHIVLSDNFNAIEVIVIVTLVVVVVFIDINILLLFTAKTHSDWLCYYWLYQIHQTNTNTHLNIRYILMISKYT